MKTKVRKILLIVWRVIVGVFPFLAPGQRVLSPDFASVRNGIVLLASFQHIALFLCSAALIMLSFDSQCRWKQIAVVASVSFAVFLGVLHGIVLEHGAR